MATLDRELDELYRIPLRPGAIPGGSFRRSVKITISNKTLSSTARLRVKIPRSDCTPLLAMVVVLLLGMASVSGARREKSTSPHCDSSRFSSSIRFWEAIFSFASRSISCSYSRSLRFNSCRSRIYDMGFLGRHKRTTYLNMAYGRMENRQVGGFLLVRLDRKLLLQLLEALLQVGPSILLQLVVHFPCTNAAGKGKKLQTIVCNHSFQFATMCLFYKKQRTHCCWSWWSSAGHRWGCGLAV